MLKVLTHKIMVLFCSAPPMFHPHCSLPSPHRVYNHLCAGVRSSSAHHLLTCKNSKETTKTYQPLFIQCKEEKTCYYNVLKVYLLPLKKKMKPQSVNQMQTQINRRVIIMMQVP